MTHQQRIEYWQTYEALRLASENRGRKRFKALLNKQALSVILYASNNGVAATIDRLNSLVKTSDTANVLRQFYVREGLPFAFREYQQVAGQKSYYVEGLRLKRQPIRTSAGFFSEYWKKLLMDFLSANAARKVVAITETTRELLRKVLVQAADQRLTMRQTAKLIRESITGINKARAANIARTESNGAANYGATIGAEAAAKQLTGARLEKIWIATPDARIRDAHRAMIGKPSIRMEDYFVVGGERMKHPGDPAASAKNICNCRCVVAHRVVRNQ